MALGNTILITSPPKGHFVNGIIGDTSKPGTQMQISAGVAAVNGLFTWVHYAATADGDPRLVAVLLEDALQGFLDTVAYVSGRVGTIYFPLPGEELNMLVQAQVGTGSANAYTVGERMMPDNANGSLIAQSSSSGNATFMVLEHIDLVANQTGLVWCQRQ